MNEVMPGRRADDSKAGVTAVNAGLPQFPVVIIDHPIWTRDEAWIEAAAAPLAAALAAKLFGDSPA